MTDAEPPPPRLIELALAFLRLGVTAFGGPAAHIAIMEEEFVRRRQWLTQQRFLDLLGAANLLPGPSSSELAIYIGFERARWPGLVVAGTCFISPAALMAGTLAFVYVRWGSLPQTGNVLYGVKPIVIAVIVQALWRLAPRALKSRPLAALGAISCVAAALGANPMLLLPGAGVVAMAARPRPRPPNGDVAIELPWVSFAAVSAVAADATPVGLMSLFLVFLKMGTVVFGSGYVLLAFLRDDLVDRLHWLTDAQLLAAITVGQVTPGPVFTTATFIGYLLAGARGAIAATVAVFLPGFAFVAMTRPLVARVRQSPTASAFLDGVNAASLALMAVVTVQLARSALIDAVTVALAVLAAGLLLRFKANTTWLMAAGALVGLTVPHS